MSARVVLHSGPLEFLACWPGKEHESILRCEGTAAHVYEALGLVGLTPGHPPEWDPATQRYGDPAGDLVDVSFAWSEGPQLLTVDSFAWLRDIEYARPPIPRPWVFAGSERQPDGTLVSDISGAGFALVDFPDSLLALSRHHSSSNAELWVEANTPAIPAIGTRVQVLLRPAQGRAYDVAFGFLGVLWVSETTAQEPGHRFCSPADLADLIRLARQLDPDYVQTIRVQGASRADELALRRALLEAGVPATSLRFDRVEATSQAAVPAERGDGAPVSGGGA